MSNSTANTDGTLRRWRGALGSCVLLYPLVMHLLIVYDMLAIALLGLTLMSLIAAVPALLDSRNRWQALPYVFIALAAFVALMSGTDFALYFPSVVFNLVFAVAFGRTLRAGETPMIERFMHLHHSEKMHPGLVRYARQLTYMWAVCCATMALTAALLGIFTSLETWSLFANVINYAVIVVLFIGQFVVGYIRYRVLTPTQIVSTAARVARRAASGAPGNR